MPSSWETRKSPAEELLGRRAGSQAALRQFLAKLLTYIPVSARDINSIHMILIQLLLRGSPITQNY